MKTSTETENEKEVKMETARDYQKSIRIEKSYCDFDSEAHTEATQAMWKTFTGLVQDQLGNGNDSCDLETFCDLVLDSFEENYPDVAKNLRDALYFMTIEEYRTGLKLEVLTLLETDEEWVAELPLSHSITSQLFSTRVREGKVIMLWAEEAMSGDVEVVQAELPTAPFFTRSLLENPSPFLGVVTMEWEGTTIQMCVSDDENGRNISFITALNGPRETLNVEWGWDGKRFRIDGEYMRLRFTHQEEETILFPIPASFLRIIEETEFMTISEAHGDYLVSLTNRDKKKGITHIWSW